MEEHRTGDCALRLLENWIYIGEWGLRGSPCPLPKHFNRGRRPEAAVVLGGWENNKEPMRMRAVSLPAVPTPLPPPVKPIRYPCPLNSPRVIVVCDSE